MYDETVADVSTALDEFEKVGLITRYQAEGRTYLEVVKWVDHQTLRSDRPIYQAYPKPPIGKPQGNQRDTTGKPEGENSHAKLSEVKLTFAHFWEKYPRKEGKKKAEEVWLKLAPSEALAQRIIAAVEAHKKTPQWTKDGGQFIPHATTFLNQERWNDVVEQPQAVPSFKSFKPV